jgi:predicted transposase/invertase (TIGR01784 family)
MLSKDRQEGIIEGMIKGKLKEKLEIACKMKKRNTPIEYIMEDTGLSKEQIESL